MAGRHGSKKHAHRRGSQPPSWSDQRAGRAVRWAHRAGRQRGAGEARLAEGGRYRAVGGRDDTAGSDGRVVAGVVAGLTHPAPAPGDAPLALVRAELTSMLSSLAETAIAVRIEAAREADRIRRDADAYAERRRNEAKQLVLEAHHDLSRRDQEAPARSQADTPPRPTEDPGVGAPVGRTVDRQ